MTINLPSPQPPVNPRVMGKFFYSAKMAEQLRKQIDSNRLKYPKDRGAIPPGFNTIHGNEYTCFVPNGEYFTIYWDDVRLVCEGCIDDAKFTPS